MIITSPRSASMDSKRLPGLAGIADFPDFNEVKGESMKGFIVPHLVEKCQL
jgi:hypothetical protein